jgi:hypothetical protein
VELHAHRYKRSQDELDKMPWHLPRIARPFSLVAGSVSYHGAKVVASIFDLKW